jgi:hypothetical protein
LEGGSEVKVLLDKGGDDEDFLEAKNYVIVYIPLGLPGHYRVVKVTHEGVSEEITDDEFVLDDRHLTHEEFLPYEEVLPEKPKCPRKPKSR